MTGAPVRTLLRYSRIPTAAEDLRQEVRAFLDEALLDLPPVRRADSWMGFDAQFSRLLGERGWIGMTLPKRYGGREASAFARYVVIEELLAVGAPVSAHWIADRQSAPMLLRYGTEAQKERFLPGICRGESFFCIGMSEPGSGSDLASITTRARRNANGWVLNGRKIWTTNAHRSHFMITLARTEEKTTERHRGMSQFIVDLKKPGIDIRPIRDLTGDEHFNEVVFENVKLSEGDLVGGEGAGWAQVTAELAYERSGPERILSCMALVNTLIDSVGRSPNSLQARELGRVAARIFMLRNMSIAVTAQLQAGENPAVAAACVKDLGVTLEQEIPEIAQAIVDLEPSSDGSDYEKVLAHLTQLAPSFSLRGGTREILRGIIARSLELR
jgi:alkylation response protein AidB-like acyl-CoA dehydrogenase